MPSCMFCGYHKASKEHVLGNWLKKFAKNLDKTTISKHTISREDIEPKRGLLDRPGSPISQTTKIVCERYNNAWMSRIEKSMTKSFSKLFERQYHDLNEDDWCAIERWLTLKALVTARWVYDKPIKSDLVQDRVLQAALTAERQKFYADPHPPMMETIIFQCNRKDVWGAHNALSTFVKREDTGELLHLQTIWIGLGPVILFSYSTAWKIAFDPMLMFILSERIKIPFYMRKTQQEFRHPAVVSHEQMDELLRVFTLGQNTETRPFRGIYDHPRKG